MPLLGENLLLQNVLFQTDLKMSKEGVCLWHMSETISTKCRCSFHIRNFHLVTLPEETNWSFGKKRFSTKANFISHISSVHMAERKYTCSLCDKRLPNKKDTKNHKRQHDDVPKLACGRLFGYKSSLIRHKESCGVTKNKCSVCDKQFVSRNALYGHRKAKHSNIIHICEKCGKSFKRKHSRIRHLKVVHKNDWCQWCKYWCVFIHLTSDRN